MIIHLRIMVSLLLASLAVHCVSSAQETGGAPTVALVQPAGKRPPPPPLPKEDRQGRADAAVPALRKVGPGLFRLGDLTISKASSSVSFPATVNMEKGLLEYLVVRKGGKTHESLLRTEVDPATLQVALLLIGLEGTDRPLARQGAAEAPRGNPVQITVSYQQDKKIVPLPAENWITKKTGGAVSPDERLSWIFTGSLIRNEVFLASVEGSIIALYHDPVALIDNASPGGESDKVWFVKEGAVPPAGTPVTVTIQAVN